MTGLDGSDTYYVDDAGDVVVEGLTGDIDRVFARVSYALAEGSEVERLQTTDAALTGAINLTGNELANAITGNAGLNLIDGGGGNDSLTGLDGSDTYLVDRPGDVVIEGLTGDFDKIRTSASYRLAVGSEVEGLMTDRSTATTAINLTGNEFGNSITGNSGINRLSGGGGNDLLAGGRGADELTGGAGSDRFDFNTILNPVSNVDTITDFSVPQDTILLDRTVFAGIAVDGKLAASAFGLGTSAQDGTDRIVYDAASGNIFYDSDGVNGTAAILFAKVDPNTPLTNIDFSAYTGG
jgi:Ca2+-binding RTX toxin-like protein